MSATTATRRVGAEAPPPQLYTNGDGTDRIKHIRSKAQLREIITQQHNGSREYWITPELARWLLELNTGNRRVSRKRVERYKHIIESGLWINTGEPFIVSDEGILNEGQHRLTAIVEAGIAVPCDIRFGIARKAFEATGTGATRTVGDVISIGHGDSHSSSIAAGARLLRMYQLGLPTSQSAITVSQEIVHASERWHDDLVYASKLATKLAVDHGLRFRNAAVTAFIVMAQRQKNRATVEEFLQIAASGLTNDPNNPARRIYERMRREAGEQRGGRGPYDITIERLAVFIKAWQAWLKNEKVSANALRLRAGEPFPVMEGVTL